MSTGTQPAQSVPVDVLPPLPKDAAPNTGPGTGKATPLPHSTAEGQPPLAGYRTFYHPASGVVILGIDLLIFGPEMLADAFTGLMALPILCVLSFLISFPLVYLIQWKWSRDTVPTALGKAFVGAFVVGLPFSVAGTMLGAAILALSGLPHHPMDMVKKLFAPSQK